MRIWATRILFAAGVIGIAACGSASPAGGRATLPPRLTPPAAASASAIGVGPWGHSVSASALPLGDGHTATSPRAGYVESCQSSFGNAGSQVDGPWINGAAATWDSTVKVSVGGTIGWPQASNSFTVNGSQRSVTTNDLPKDLTTGSFPISSSDPAYRYDRNPNAISAQSLTYTFPATPEAAAQPSCVGMGPIGVMLNGVVFFNALDNGGRDAVAHEIQDSCGGHPQRSGMYHYHGISNCFLQNAAGTATLVGYGFDGFGIYVERDAKGNLPTDQDLDACHGRTSSAMWDGSLVTMYHYDVTLEYPYTIGCFHGTSNVQQSGGAAGGIPPPN